METPLEKAIRRNKRRLAMPSYLERVSALLGVDPENVILAGEEQAARAMEALGALNKAMVQNVSPLVRPEELNTVDLGWIYCFEYFEPFDQQLNFSRFSSFVARNKIISTEYWLYYLDESDLCGPVLVPSTILKEIFHKAEEGFDLINEKLNFSFSLYPFGHRVMVDMIHCQAEHQPTP